MIADLIHAGMTRRDARTALRDAGWAFIGGGSFSTVYSSPDGSVVAKVTKPDDGADGTYRAARAHPLNPHLPAYFDRIELVDGGTVYEVERLLPFDGPSSFYDAEVKQRNTRDYQEAYEALAKEGGHYGGVDDIHWKNAMMRPSGELVMTDYLAGNLYHATACDADSEKAKRGEYRSTERRGSNHWAEVAEAA